MFRIFVLNIVLIFLSFKALIFILYVAHLLVHRDEKYA